MEFLICHWAIKKSDMKNERQIQEMISSPELFDEVESLELISLHRKEDVDMYIYRNYR